ncbi:hypothetical protein AAG906_029129 [Vitis piasezkii]
MTALFCVIACRLSVWVAHLSLTSNPLVSGLATGYIDVWEHFGDRHINADWSLIIEGLYSSELDFMDICATRNPLGCRGSACVEVMTTLHGSAPSLRRCAEGCVPSEGLRPPRHYQTVGQTSGFYYSQSPRVQYRPRAPHQSYDQAYIPPTLALPHVSYSATGQPCYATQFTARPTTSYPRPRAQQTSASFALRT